MGLFRSAMGLFRGRAGKNREKMAAELPEEQAKTVKAQPEVAPREVKYEARPNPDKPGSVSYTHLTLPTILRV